MGLTSLARSCGKGFKAYDARKFSEALHILKPIADLDTLQLLKPSALNAPKRAAVCVAQYYVALMYFYGNGVEADESLGMFYIRKAAELGHPDAIKYLNDIGE